MVEFFHFMETQPNRQIFLVFLFSILLHKTESILLKTALIDIIPFTNTSKGFFTGGFSVDLMNEVSKITNNITFEPYIVSDGQFGDKINGSWTGIMKDLITGKADITFAPMTYTAERAKSVQFSSPYLNVGLRLMELKKKQQTKLDSFLLPFHWTVWISVIGVIFLVGVLLWIFDLISPYGLSKINNPELNLANAFLNSGIGL